MANPSELLECRWGNLRLFASQVHTDSGRTQVVHELSSGDVHPVQDRGLRIRRVRCQLQFDDFPGQPSPRDAAIALEEAKNTGKPAIFQHPIIGRFLASIGEYNSTTDEHSVISAECEFIQEAADIAVTPTGPSSGGASGEGSVDAAAEELDDNLASVGQLKMSGPAAAALLSQLPGGNSLSASLSRSLSTDLSVNLSASISASIALSVTANATASASAAASVSATATATVSATALATAGVAVGAGAAVGVSAFAFVDVSASLAAAASAEASVGLFAATTIDARVAIASWSSGDVPTRQITNDAARISNNIATMIEAGGFEDDIALWPAFRAAIMLGESVRAAAIAATSSTPTVFTMRVTEPTALLPLAARVYGGAQATERARQITELNDISTPGWLPPGDYLIPTRPAAPTF